MKSVAILINTLLSGGAEKQSVLLSKVLSEDYRVFLIVLNGFLIENKFISIINNTKVELIKLEGNFGVNLFRVIKIIKCNQIDIVFSFLLTSNVFNSFIKLFSNTIAIGGIRNAFLPTKKRIFERILHNYINNFTISNSQSAVSNLSKLGFKKDKFIVIHNAFDLKREKIVRINTKTIKILSVSRFVPQKDIRSAIEAINILNKKINVNRLFFKYYLIGYGIQERAIREKINDLKLNDVVEIIIKPNNLETYFIESDIFLTTSLFEGVSNSVLEALSFSLPIVATNAGDMKYLVKDGINGYICEMNNPKNIASKLEKVILDKNLRSKMGAESYKIIMENFTMKSFKDKYLSLINELN